MKEEVILWEVVVLWSDFGWDNCVKKLEEGSGLKYKCGSQQHLVVLKAMGVDKITEGEG